MNNRMHLTSRPNIVAILLILISVGGFAGATEAKRQTLEERCQAYKDNAGHNLRKLDLNTATEEDLQTLPGIGIKTARAIIDHRQAIRGFKSLEQLLRVRGVGTKVYNCLKDLLTVGNSKE